MQTCNVFVSTFDKQLFKWRDVLHIGCVVERVRNHIVLLSKIKFNAKLVKQKPLESCLPSILYYDTILREEEGAV